MSAMERSEDIRFWLRSRVAELTGADPEGIDVGKPFSEIGLDSGSAVELCYELEELLGRELPVTVLWDHPDIAALSGWLLHGEVADGSAADGLPESTAVAVIGIGCRFPGASRGPEDFWRLLLDGRNAVDRVSSGRWERTAGPPPFAGSLDDVHGFDDEHFGISPREAAAMDPQQRLLLEVSWEALEHAGLAPDTLRGSDTGAFVGVCSNEYAQIQLAGGHTPDPYVLTGSALSITANRLSYFYDLRGPSLAVDTACSSSLVAVHLACESIRAGECETALCGAVNLLLSSQVTAAFERAGAMSSDGRCKAFSADADGYVRGEGCGVVVLKRLDAAVRDGDRVLAVVRGTAVGQDGRSNGLMAPRPDAQAAVLRKACQAAGVDPREIDYVEAHGTGTLLGDPIEAKALGEVLGTGRVGDDRLRLGSVKTNIGHLEAAAGMAGLIKTVLALRYRHIPASLHFERPNPHIPFERLGLRVVDRATHWPERGPRGLAGVSSFGFGGTNAHVILEEASDREAGPSAAAPPTAGGAERLVLGGLSHDRVAEAAGRLADWLQERPQTALRDVAHSLARRRPGPVRAVIVAQDGAGALAGLREAASGGDTSSRVRWGIGQPGLPGPVWVFSGQGSQWTGMGRRLLEAEPAFATALRELEPDFETEAGFSLLDAISSGRPVETIDVVQPVLYAMQVALARLWRSYGVEPAAVVGHSVGEIAAAVVAGGLTVRDGLRVAARRSRLMRRVAGKGKMLVLGMPAPDAAKVAQRFSGVEIAVYAAPSQTVLAGPADKIDLALSWAEAEDIPAHPIAVDVASHSRQMDPLLNELEASLRDVRGSAPRTPFISTVLDHGAAPAFDALYWCANLRRPVRFAQAISAAATGHSVFVEISPHPVLSSSIAECAPNAELVPTLRRDADDTLVFHTALATLQAAGLADPRTQGRLLDLPTTAWRHVHHQARPGRAPTAAALPARAPSEGTLLGEHRTIALEPPCHVWERTLHPDAPVFPGRHSIAGMSVLPASVLLNTALQAAESVGENAVRDVGLLRPVFTDRPADVQVILQDGALTLSARSGDESWSTALTGLLGTDAGEVITAPPELDEGIRVNPAALAARAADLGFEGPAFPWTATAVVRDDVHMVAEVRVDGALGATALLDAAFQLAPFALEEACVPIRVGTLSLLRPPQDGEGEFRIRSRLRGVSDGDADFDITVESLRGRSLVTMTGVGYRRFAPPADQMIHGLVWTAGESAGAPARSEPLRTAIVLGNKGDLSEAIAAELSAAGIHADQAGPGAFSAAEAVILVAPEITEAVHVPAAARLACQTLVRTITAMSAHPTGRLWIVTHGVRNGTSSALAQAPLWGLGQVIGTEFPDRWGGIIDLDPDDPVDVSAAALVMALREGASDLNAISRGERLVAELAPTGAHPAASPGPPITCAGDGTYLITGGMGELGLRMARFLAERGARRLLLVGRTALPEHAEWDSVTDPAVLERITAIRALEESGVTVVTAAVDVADAQALREAVGDPASVRGVVHAAGVAVDRPVTELDADVLGEVMSGKLAGAWALHEHFPPKTLDFMIFFSSAGALLGVPGQGAYAAANRFLDTLAAHRVAEGCRTVSIGWGPWRGMGMAATGGGLLVQSLLRGTGLRPLGADEAVSALDHVHGLGVAHAVVLSGVPPTLRRHLPRDLDRWTAMPASKRHEELVGHVRLAVREEMGIEPGEIDDDRPLAERGLDSIMAVGICRRLGRSTGLRIPATLLWRFPTVDGITGFLADQLTAQTAAPPETAATSAPGAGNPLEALLDELTFREGETAS